MRLTSPPRFVQWEKIDFVCLFEFAAMPERHSGDQAHKAKTNAAPLLDIIRLRWVAVRPPAHGDGDARERPARVEVHAARRPA